MGRQQMVSGQSDATVTWDDHTATHLRDPDMRVGQVTVTVLDTSVNVSFSSDMQSTNYQVFIQTQNNVGTTAYPGTLRTNGFMLNLSIGVNATFSYLAVENA